MVYERQDNAKISKLVSLKKDPHEILGEVFGKPFKEYREKWDAAERMELKLNYPLHVDLEINYACNLKCPMCTLSLPKEEIAKTGDQKKKLTYDTAIKLINEGSREGQVALGLNGINEPLLTPWLPKVVKHARDSGYLDILFCTNGVLLTEDKSSQLIDAGLTRLQISLDAMTKETYDKIRVGSNFELVMKNIESLLRIREEKKSVLPLVRVSFVTTSINEHEREEFIKYWGKRVDFLSIQQYSNPFEGQERKLKESLRAKTIEFGYDTGFQCPKPWVRALVRNDGSVQPCCDFHGQKLIMGNIHEQSLKSLWNSPKWEDLRKLHAEGKYYENPVCNDCVKSLVGQYEKIIPGKAK